MTGSVILERSEPLATITLSNPGKRNALNHSMYRDLTRMLRDLAADSQIRTVVLRGADGHFAGGTDIEELRAISTGADGVRYEAQMRKVQEALIGLRVPVVSVVEGVCVGGGLVLAALSDIVLCEPGARFGSPIAHTIGNTLSPTSIDRMQALLGRRRATEMLLTGRLIDAGEAEQAGFVTAVVDQSELEPRLHEMVARLCRAAPRTIASIKEFQFRLDQTAAPVPVDDVYFEVYASTDFQRGVEGFLARRPADFTGD